MKFNLCIEVAAFECDLDEFAKLVATLADVKDGLPSVLRDCDIVPRGAGKIEVGSDRSDAEDGEYRGFRLTIPVHCAAQAAYMTARATYNKTAEERQKIGGALVSLGALASLDALPKSSAYKTLQAEGRVRLQQATDAENVAIADLRAASITHEAWWNAARPLIRRTLGKAATENGGNVDIEFEEAR